MDATCPDSDERADGLTRGGRRWSLCVPSRARPGRGMTLQTRAGF